MLNVPNLGTISYEDYDLQEMPSPIIAKIEGYRFDFKNSIRNADFRSGKQYESNEIKLICPNLYFKKFKVSLFPLFSLKNFPTERTSAPSALRKRPRARTARYERPTLQVKSDS